VSALARIVVAPSLFDLIVRMEPQFRSGARDIGNLLVPAPGGQQIPLSELATIKEASGASFIGQTRKKHFKRGITSLSHPCILVIDTCRITVEPA